MVNAAMVLEGGAKRGIFTGGVLDYLMERDFYTSYTVGVSAGACNALDYVSKQIGRSKDSTIGLEGEYSYQYTTKQMIKERAVLNMQMLFDEYPNHLFPFDYDTFFNSEMECELVLTNCLTGKAEYFSEKSDRERLMKVTAASCSMPLASPIQMIDDIPYLDGGISDAVPLVHAHHKGYQKKILVLTRPYGYRKKLISRAEIRMYEKAYPSYPNFLNAMIMRPKYYNHIMRTIERLEKESKIFVIRPEIKTVSRLEKNPKKLEKFYQHGYDLMKARMEELQIYMEL